MAKIVLDQRTTENFKYVIEHDKEFSLNFAGPCINDTGYSLTLTSADNEIEYVFNSSTLILTSENIELVFDPINHKKGFFYGVLTSDSKATDRYLKINMNILFE